MYTEIFELQSELLKALAHPRRLEIIQLLRNHALCVSDIYEMLDLPQANISQHLMILRDANVVTTSKQGKQVIYSVTDEKILEASDLLRAVLIEQHQGTPIASSLALRMQDLLPLVIDPVCHMRLSPKTAGYHTHHSQQEYYFCASGCLKKFMEKPSRYV
ncbi:MAG: metalloregulator ArsR/SmtB family transcription factor [bacterium]|nr:metalloregulator ArsR/SmtB family transcription factor [bacterium]